MLEKTDKSFVKINTKRFSLKLRFTLFFAIVFVPGPAQETSKIRQEAAQEPPNSVQSSPRATQELPKATQERPKAARIRPERPKSHPKAAGAAQEPSKN